MNVLLVHNFYQQPGGEDQVYRDEAWNLGQHGVQVSTFSVSNDSISSSGQLKTAAKTLWNADIARQLAGRVREERIEVVHFHNTFPLVSPAAYRAVRREGAAVVQTLHNFRLLCAAATLYRVRGGSGPDGSSGDGTGGVCEDCLGKFLIWPAVEHRCYRDSRAGSAVVAGMLGLHRALGSYRDQVDAYIALTESGRQKFIQGGLPANLLLVKPNFLIETPAPGGSPAGAGGHALYVGRLTREKGLLTLLEAWRGPDGHPLGARLPLKVAGDGPLLAEVQRRAAGLEGVEVLGQQSREEVGALIRGARCLIVPSEWYETFGLVVLEAYAAGVPVVASDIGSLSSLVEHGVTGRHFRPGDPADLRAQVEALLADPAALSRLGEAARRTYLSRYTPEINARQQLDIYQQAIARRRGGKAARPDLASSR